MIDNDRRLNALQKFGIRKIKCSLCGGILRRTPGFHGDKTHYVCDTCGEYEAILGSW